MANQYPIDKMARRIRAIRKAAQELKELCGGIQAVERNADRILASTRMLELNVNEAAGISRQPRRS